MVQTVQIKLEADREGFSAPPPSNHNQMTSHVTSTSNNDSVLSAAVASIFSFDRIRLVKLREKDEEGNVVDTKLWPALWFSSEKELYATVGVGAKIKIATFVKQQKEQGHTFSHGYGTAFLLGRQTIEESIILTLGEHMVESFEERIDELLEKDDYKNNPEFMASVAIALERADDVFSSNEKDVQDDESQTDDGTVALDFDNTTSSPSSDQTIAAEVMPVNSGGISAEEKDDEAESEEEEEEGDDGDDSGSDLDSAESDEPRDGISQYEHKRLQRIARNEARLSSLGLQKVSGHIKRSMEETKKQQKRNSEGTNDGSVSKKKTPKGKSRGSQPSVVTPPHPQAKSDHKEIAQALHEALVDLYVLGTPHRVIKHDDAWKLLTEKFGITCVDGKYFLPQSYSVSDKPVATSLMGLREHLCEKGLPDNTQPLSEKEEVDIARWVRYAHVKGLEDGQEISPDDLGKPIKKFMNAWTILCNNFGCSWSPGKYKVPLTPDGGEVQVFQTDHDVERHFAKFGIPCIPSDPGDRLNQKDRLSIELFYSTPLSLDVLNTFERVDDKVNRKRKRKPVSYSE